MAKVIKAIEVAADAVKMVSIKHTKVMKDASDKDVTVLDWEETKNVDDAITDAEAQKAKLEGMLKDVEADLVEYKKVKDA
jgi:hypothetical protein|tara:strand:- start:125 stop:364 length:240 start_codon:yes stop_codon:yes gene_type:complete